MSPPVVLPSSSINKTAYELGPAPAELQPLAEKLIRYGGGANAPSGEIGLSMMDYSTPIYQVNIDPTTNRIIAPLGGFWTYGFATGDSIGKGSQGNFPAGGLLPDSTKFVAGTGYDNIFLIENRNDGRVWSIWMARQPGINSICWTNILAGLTWKTPQHTYGGCSVTRPFLPAAKPNCERGMGIDKRALITTGEEIVSGVINHAAELTITNTWYCSGSVQYAKAGIDYLYPATRCEWDAARAVYRPGYVADKTKLVPEGLRIAFNMTKLEREAWLDFKGLTGPFRTFCRILIDCWCDYGLVVAETGGWGMRSEMTGMLGPDRPIYESYGWRMETLKAQEYALGSFMRDNMASAYVVNPLP